MKTYDAIIVGARCAGSPLAMLLARRGHDVLLVDKATFPSDTMSTLVIQPHGVEALQRWGLLDDVVATGCPPIEKFTFDFGPLVISGRPRLEGSGPADVYAPRRTLLDAILVDAAAGAGAEVRQGFTLDEVLIEDDTVVGIKGHGVGGGVVTERARVVVGADGWNSAVARAVGAEVYNDKPVLENAFYTFWEDVPTDGMTTYIRGDRAAAVIPTNGATLVLVGCPFAQAAGFRRDVENNYRDAVDRIPELAARLAEGRQLERFVGGGVPNFFRTPFGPGWALVGDAGYNKDPITAQGISDAFRGAEDLAEALEATWSGNSNALAANQQKRDAAALPLYEFTTNMATLEPPPPELAQLLGAIQGNQSAMDSFVSVMSGTLSPVEFFDPAHLASVGA